MKNKLTKIVMSVTLSFSLLLGGTAAFTAKPAHATTTTEANRIISTAKRYLGTPYRFGASTSTTRYFDCSSFTKYLYKKQGIYLPRESKDQAKRGRYVGKSNLKKGDLVFFYKPIHHVGIYIGDGKIIHTYGKPGVMISSIRTGWWAKHYTTARRVS
ncbi:C40 family peptidase [Paenibacillus montanisoli]|uniref:NlpC/P60 family protein n=1 Tax=Paenibacillus montanisoli TaxID=2081970 RepID=A0A328U900_9BACL|nr:C40 family peptidase [Paenibacillus montanisoli]RAP78283.1 NlpC/P60 family protein [Paenibacillus montanisoli]